MFTVNKLAKFAKLAIIFSSEKYLSKFEGNLQVFETAHALAIFSVASVLKDSVNQAFWIFMAPLYRDEN